MFLDLKTQNLFLADLKDTRCHSCLTFFPMDERLKRGIELFNRGDFFECHEELESLWFQTGGDNKDCLKGLIQCAVALYHLHHGNQNGARKVLETALQYLAPYCPQAFGIDLDRLTADMTHYFDATYAQGGGKRLSPPHIG